MEIKIKELYTTPEIKVEELSGVDVICESIVTKKYNIEGTYNKMFTTWTAEDFL